MGFRRITATLLQPAGLAFGRLNYCHEKVLEAYYALAVNKWLTWTIDYQLITNPACNANRGPVSIFSGRVHAEC